LEAARKAGVLEIMAGEAHQNKQVIMHAECLLVTVTLFKKKENKRIERYNW
jgi:hypothetical protein